MTEGRVCRPNMFKQFSYRGATHKVNQLQAHSKAETAEPRRDKRVSQPQGQPAVYYHVCIMGSVNGIPGTCFSVVQVQFRQGRTIPGRWDGTGWAG